MKTCSVPMGILASRHYIIQTYGDNHLPLRIVQYFEEIAGENGSSATLNIHTAEMTLEVGEVGGVAGWRALHTERLNREDTKYQQWLREAHAIASAP